MTKERAVQWWPSYEGDGIMTCSDCGARRLPWNSDYFPDRSVSVCHKCYPAWFASMFPPTLWERVTSLFGKDSTEARNRRRATELAETHTWLESMVKHD